MLKRVNLLQARQFSLLISAPIQLPVATPDWTSDYTVKPAPLIPPKMGGIKGTTIEPAPLIPPKMGGIKGTTIEPTLLFPSILGGNKGTIKEIGTSSLFFPIKNKKCPSKSEEVQKIFKLLGKWDIDVTAPSDTMFIVILLSHTDIEPFYEKGYWWKAKLELAFSDDIAFRFNDTNIVVRKCKQFRLNVHKTEICYAPSYGRREDCQESKGLPPQSIAEVELRDRIGGKLREALLTKSAFPPTSLGSTIK